MEKPLHVKLLELMAVDGVGCNFNVVEFIRENFVYPSVDRFLTPKKEEDRIDFFFDDLVKRNFIAEYGGESIPLGWRFDRVGDIIETTYMGSELFYVLTSTGLDYLIKYQDNQSNIDLNKSYKRVNEASLLNYIIQKWGMGVTISIAMVAAVFSIAGYFKSEPKMVELNKNIQALSKQTEGIKIEIAHLKTHKTLNADSSRKH